MIHVFTRDLQAVTCVPNSFIDDKMKSANGDYVKVYLYLLRQLSSVTGSLSVSAIADYFDYTESDVMRALRFWEKAGLVSLEFNAQGTLTGICMLQGTESKSSVPAVNNVDLSVRAENVASIGAPKSYSADELSAFKQNPDVKELLFVTEKYLGRTLSISDINMILSWHDAFGLSISLIEHLIEECVDQGHTSLHYMNKVAISWAENGIDSVEDAKRSAQIHSQSYYGVMKAMGISGRELVPSERDTVEKWTGDYGFSLDIITEACRRTVTNTGKPNFPYADAILTRWYEAGVKHSEDIAGLSSERKEPSIPRANTGKISDFPTRDYDYTLLEQQLLKSQME